MLKRQNCSVDAKIDNGYLVSMNLGSKELKGVLYHCPDVFHSSGSSTASEILPHQEEQEGTSRMAVSIPSRPKANARGYTFFFAEQYPKLEPLCYGQKKDISKEIGHLWSELTKAEKQVYQEKGKREKRIYEMALLVYRSNTKAIGL